MSGKLKAVVLLGIAFALGVVSGISWQRYRFHQWPGRHTEMYAERRVRRLKSQLDLSPQQEVTVREIFQKAHERATQVNEEVSWDLADIHRDSVKAIIQVLTPEQARKFKELHDRFHARHKNMSADDLDESTSTVRAVAS